MVALLVAGAMFASAGVYAALPPPCDAAHGCGAPPTNIQTTMTSTPTTSTKTTTPTVGSAPSYPYGLPATVYGIVPASGAASFGPSDTLNWLDGTAGSLSCGGCLYPPGGPTLIDPADARVVFSASLLTATQAAAVFGTASSSHLMILYGPIAAAPPSNTVLAFKTMNGYEIVGSQAVRLTFPAYQVITSWGAPAIPSCNLGTTCPAGAPMYVTSGYYPDVNLAASALALLMSAFAFVPASALPLVGGGAAPAVILVVLGVALVAAGALTWRRR